MALNLFTIPAGEAFLDRLAHGLIARHGAASLPDLLVFVPNRRSVQALGQEILAANGGAMTFLPRIRAIGDVEDDDLILDPGPDFEDFEIPPAISAIERQLILTRLILGAGDAELSFASALQLAAQLARLIDEVQIQKGDFTGLEALAPERYAAHWQRILDFLKIVTTHWPAILRERAEIDPADRRARLIRTLAARWRATPPATQVIIAGSTGSQAATAELIGVVARCPTGCVVLPGLDQWLDAPSWEVLEASHPQYVLKQLLTRIEATRDDVAVWPSCRTETDPRAQLLAEAMRPAEMTDLWRGAAVRLAPVLDSALVGLTRIEAANDLEEASTIALILREVLETPGRTAFLVTQDRALARRVAAELARWEIEIDDSAGHPLSVTGLGTFLRSVLAAVADRLAPASLLSLLKHPLARADRDAVAQLEIGALRGARPAPGSSGLLAALGEDPAADFGATLAQLIAPLERLGAGRHSVRSWIEAHIGIAEAMAGADQLWTAEEGHAALDIFDRLIEADDVFPALTIADYAAIIDALFQAAPIRPQFGTHPRLAILGPIEARLQHADLVVLGGLNEDSWPATESADPWFSRGMRAEFGLEPPERRIGQSAHDFASAASAPDIILSRAVKVGGTPSVASRWLLRLENLLRSLGREDVLTAGRKRLALAALLDRPAEFAACPAPAPRPPVAARPRSLSVTEIERLIRDPYAIYARRILNLAPLDPIDADPGAAERGTMIHKILEGFARATADGLPDPAGSVALILEIARREAGEWLDRPGIAGLWWPRIIRMAEFLARIEPELRAEGRILGAEISGELIFPIGEDMFRLRARADRIDLRHGGLAIIDYKTGTAPTAKEMKAGLSVQLPLEAAIAVAGGFRDVPATPVASLEILRLTGGAVPGERHRPDVDAMEVAASSFAELKRHLENYADPAMPYRSRPRVQFQNRADDYDHLARVREWSAAGE